MNTFEKNIKNAVRVLKKGGTIVYPTDTVYGLGVDVTNIKAVERLLQMKNRSNQATSIIVSNIEIAKEFVKFSKLAEKVFKKFTPGPITLVLPLQKFVSESIQKLSANTGTLGIRIPSNQTARVIVERFGKPMTTTSANPRGGNSPYSVKESLEQFERNIRDLRPDFYFDEGILGDNPPSTIIRILRNEIEVIRKGSLSKKQILERIQV